MNNTNKSTFYNYRYILCLALISFLLVSCQKTDPLNFFPKDSNSLGYHKVSSADNSSFVFGVSSILNKIDSTYNLSVILSDIDGQKDFEIYYSFFNEKDFSALIKCTGFGDKLKNKMIYEKAVTNFNFKEIFSEKNTFISPIDENTVLIGSNMEDIRKAIKRNEAKSVLSNTLLSGLKKEIPETASEWFITSDSLKIAGLVLPIGNDSLSNFTKNSSKFKSCVFYNDGKSTLLIDGEDFDVSIGQLVNAFKTESANFNYSGLVSRIPKYNFSSMEINNTNNKFRIKIK